jgi:hypothetical protein
MTTIPRLGTSFAHRQQPQLKVVVATADSLPAVSIAMTVMILMPLTT